MQLKIQVLRYVDDHFPGWVECELIDAEGNRHNIVEKVPGVTDDWFGPEDSYPKSGHVRCEILERWRDADGRDLMRVTTERPDSVETKEGVSEFVVFPFQVVSAEATITELELKATAYEERTKSEPKRAAALMQNAQVCREWIAALKNGHWKS